MRYIELFAGIACSTVAWHRLGWRPLAFAEIEPFPSAVLAHHYPGVPNLGDMTKVDWSQYRGLADLVVGGSPCQAFSVAGLRNSLDDHRGNLTLEYVRAIKAIQPRFAVWENVPGVLSTKDNAFGCFLAALVGAPEAIEVEGRWPRAGVVCGPEGLAEWRTLDAQHFGVPQRRRRVFLVFHSGAGADCELLLFERPRVCWNPPAREKPREETAGSLAARTRGGGGLGTDFDCMGGLQPVGVRPTIRAGGNRTGGDRPPGTDVDTADSPVVTHALRADGFDVSEDGTGRGTQLVPVAATLKANNGGGGFGSDPNETFIPCTIPIQEVGKRTGTSTTDPRAGIGIGNEGDPMYTLQAGAQHGIAFNLRGREGGAIPEVTDVASLRAASGGSSRTYVGVRRLTPTECERLMGLPDGYTDIPFKGKRAADGPRYKACGNGMVTNCMEWIGMRIQEAEDAKADSLLRRLCG